MLAGVGDRGLFERFPLLDSMREVLAELPDGEELVLPCIYSEMEGSVGWYDYIFRRENGEGGQPVIRWSTFNLSRQYVRVLALQQAFQESVLARETASRVRDENQVPVNSSNILDTLEKENRLIVKNLSELQRGLME